MGLAPYIWRKEFGAAEIDRCPDKIAFSAGEYTPPSFSEGTIGQSGRPNAGDYGSTENPVMGNNVALLITGTPFAKFSLKEAAKAPQG
ncbi:MAG: hypothetical protein PW788_11815 [Micavibrio sp.]|nr:hypothetical protein [Micavibrio sp.]